MSFQQEPGTREKQMSMSACSDASASARVGNVSSRVERLSVLVFVYLQALEQERQRVEESMALESATGRG